MARSCLQPSSSCRLPSSLGQVGLPPTADVRCRNQGLGLSRVESQSRNVDFAGCVVPEILDERVWKCHEVDMKFAFCESALLAEYP